MPKTAKKSSGTKKSGKKPAKTTKRAATKSATTRAVKKSEGTKNPLTHHYFAKEQHDFHAKHPRANSLIATFILAFGVLVILYVSQTY